MDTTRTFVIVGGGLAAAEAAKTLRGEGFDGRLVVVTEEPRLPYERPPLTKEYLRGEVGQEKLLAQPAAFYDEASIDLLIGNPAVELDPGARSIRLRDGSRLRYDGLLIATGARAVRPRMPGADEPFVHLVRTVADADRLRDAAGHAASAVVVGGGWIAAEAAASLAQRGLAVTMVVPGGEVLEQHLGPEVGRLFSELHERHGVRLRRHARVDAVTAGRDRGVRLATGDVVPGDLVVLGLGASPATELAREAGIETDGGIIVDERLATRAEDVYAAGDVAAAWHPRYGRRVSSAHWDNARRQGRTAARGLLGRSEPFERVPYFFSDQFDLGMELIGMPALADEVALRRREGGTLALWLRNGRVVAGMHANVWDAKKPIDALVTAEAVLDRDAFEDGSLPLETTVAAAA